MLDGSFLHLLYLGPDSLFPHLLMGFVDLQKVAKDLSLIPPCLESVFLRAPGVNLGSSSVSDASVVSNDTEMDLAPCAI